MELHKQRCCLGDGEFDIILLERFLKYSEVLCISYHTRSTLTQIPIAPPCMQCQKMSTFFSAFFLHRIYHEWTLNLNFLVRSESSTDIILSWRTRCVFPNSLYYLFVSNRRHHKTSYLENQMLIL